MSAKVTLKSDNMLTVPVVAMRGTVLFPNTVNHFDVGRKKSVLAIEYAMKTRTPVLLIAQRDTAGEEPQKDDLYRYGVVAEIQQVLRLAENYVKVIVSCRYRARLIDFHSNEEKYYTATIMRANVRPLKDIELDGADAIVRTIRDQLDEYIEYFPRLANDIVMEGFSERDPAKLVEYLTHNLNLDFAIKQDILEESNTMKRLIRLYNALIKENNILNIERDITNKVQESIDQNQREYYLREQIKVISDELGEGGDTVTEAEEYRKKVKDLPLEAAYIKKLLKEVERLVQTPSNSQEAAVIRTYLDTVTELPWNVFTKDSFNLKNAQRIFDRDHYGLTKVKERIVEFLAVRSLTENMNSQIICLVGPPGVGKTSIARSIAECMKRKFVRMSLGGVRDESEIRGHRRTYVGSMPGRIINAIDHAGSANPLILLDEIDKLGNDYRGDPASALLEVLDPEQNNSFRDHFLDLPFDLSKVLFITTANDPSSIPAPLYDRMDVIELSSYTRDEKLKIAKLHLVKKQLVRHGLTKEQFSITDKALFELIDDYTREAGVRNLERSIAKLIRKCARMIVEGETTAVKVDNFTLEKLLGPPMNRGSIASHKEETGIVNGLAWTSVGGEVMPIETTVVSGTG
ncbi:MAG: endopeptidase La, partial [Ruminococcaceae bacterium]|nr:endopeptidase La [Oscillospiraceae bacterium]